MGKCKRDVLAVLALLLNSRLIVDSGDAIIVTLSAHTKLERMIRNKSISVTIVPPRVI